MCSVSVPSRCPEGLHTEAPYSSSGSAGAALHGAQSLLTTQCTMSSVPVHNTVLGAQCSPGAVHEEAVHRARFSGSGRFAVNCSLGAKPTGAAAHPVERCMCTGMAGPPDHAGQTGCHLQSCYADPRRTPAWPWGPPSVLGVVALPSSLHHKATVAKSVSGCRLPQKPRLGPCDTVCWVVSPGSPPGRETGSTGPRTGEQEATSAQAWC